MSVKLVADNTVVPLDVPNYADVPSCLRRLADEVEAGTHGDVFRTIALIEREDGIAIVRLGEITTAYELMGLFEAAKLRVFAEDFIEDE